MIFNVGGGGGTAESTSYDNSASGLNADNVQSAIDEVNGKLGDIQVATLTVTTALTGLAGQAVTIANSAYSITRNFNQALSVSFPIYTWGDYMVTCGTVSSSVSITDEATEYNVELVDGTFLFRNGNKCIDLTGGWSVGSASGNTISEFEISDTAILLTRSASGGTYRGITTNAKVDLTPYSKIKFTFALTNLVQGSTSYPKVYLPTSRTSCMSNSIGTLATDVSDTSIEFDISSVNAERFLSIINSSGSYAVGEIYTIELIG